MSTEDQLNLLREFYERQYADSAYSGAEDADEHYEHQSLLGCIQKYELYDKRILEVGCGRGAFQGLVDDYVGIDIAEKCGDYLHKLFSVGSATSLPFADNTFDAIWSISVLEHIPDPEKAWSRCGVCLNLAASCIFL